MQYDICVIGLGYIGLPTASMFATKGKKVFGVDVRRDVVDLLNKGKIHFEEPDLDVVVRAAVQSGNLKAGLQPVGANTFIIAVPTPFTPTASNPRAPDLSYVEAASRQIAPFVKSGNLVILESTSPVGTTEKVRGWILAEQTKLASVDREGVADILFAHCPERVLPGQMLKELVVNDRIAGGLTPEAGEKAKELYKNFCAGQISVTDAHTAELVKLVENSFRDVNIAFANELSLICDHLHLNVWDVIALANRHPRVKILQPGPGVGGHCIAVDPWFIVDSAPLQSRLIRTAREVNNHKPEYVLEKILEQSSRFKNPIVACLGLSFKADIDDLRESPAVEIVHALADTGKCMISVVEPHISALPRSLDGHDNVRLDTIEAAVAKADIVVLLVSHKEFLNIDPCVLRSKVIIDTRGAWR